MRKRPGVEKEEWIGDKIHSDTILTVIVADDGRNWTGEAKRISKQLDPSGNNRIQVRIRHNLVPSQGGPIDLDTHDGLPEYRRFIFFWATILVIAECLVFWPLPIGQSGLLLALLGAALLFGAEGGCGRPVKYAIEPVIPAHEMIRTMLIRTTGFLSMAMGSSLQFIAMSMTP